MKCSKCGDIIDDSFKICPNCGEKTNSTQEDSQYVLLTDYDRIDESYDDYFEPPKKQNKTKIIVAIVLAVAIIVGGLAVYFTQTVNPKKPAQAFTTGYGIINDNEPVIFVGIEKNAQIEYIHGVKLYAYDKGENDKIGEYLSTDYEYTKSVDGTFRAIFFDASDFNIEPDNEYTYTFEIDLGFANDAENVYTYYEKVTFPGKISGDASDKIFDHSMDEASQGNSNAEATEKVTQNAESTTAPAESTTLGDVTYIYNSFWYTSPVAKDDSYIISAIKFYKGGKCVITNYNKFGTKKWSVINENAKYEIKDSNIVVTDASGNNQTYAVDSASKLINGLVARKFNSVKNAEDFFGI